MARGKGGGLGFREGWRGEDGRGNEEEMVAKSGVEEEARKQESKKEEKR